MAHAGIRPPTWHWTARLVWVSTAYKFSVANSIDAVRVHVGFEMTLCVRCISSNKSTGLCNNFCSLGLEMHCVRSNCSYCSISNTFPSWLISSCIQMILSSTNSPLPLAFSAAFVCWSCRINSIPTLCIVDAVGNKVGDRMVRYSLSTTLCSLCFELIIWAVAKCFSPSLKPSSYGMAKNLDALSIRYLCNWKPLRVGNEKWLWLLSKGCSGICAYCTWKSLCGMVSREITSQPACKYGAYSFQRDDV